MTSPAGPRGAAIRELFGIPPQLLDDDRLGRGLERFAPCAEAVRGALAARAIERFGLDAGRLHVDLTALRMSGAYEDSSLIAKGWAQGQGVDRQVRALQASSAEGVSLYLRPEAGLQRPSSPRSAPRWRALRCVRPGKRPRALLLDLRLRGRCAQDALPDRRAPDFLHRPAQSHAPTAGALPGEVGPAALAPLAYRLRARARACGHLSAARYRGAIRDWEVSRSRDAVSSHRFRARLRPLLRGGAGGEGGPRAGA